jgi:hypothetical protein
MDRYLGIDLESQLHGRAFDRKNRDFQQALEIVGLANDHRFSALP